MIRSFASISEPQTPYDLPMEVPYMLFENLDLRDLVTVERVCKTWFQLSVEHNSTWTRIAHQKKILLIPGEPVRVQVLSSFFHYCKAARIIFPRPLQDIPCENNPASERVLIDEVLTNHRGSEQPKLSIIQQLTNPNREPRLFDTDNLDVKIAKRITRMNQETLELIAKLQVSLETHTEFEFKFFEDFKKSEFCFGSYIIINFFKNRCRDGNFARPFPASQSHLSLNYIKLLDTANDAALPFIHYLFQNVHNPSLSLQIYYYTSCAYSEIMKALIPIRIILHEKQDALNSLLENLSGNEWIRVFETFMESEKLDLDLKINYPKQLQEIIKNWNDQEIKACTAFMTLQIPDSYSQMNAYLLEKINYSIEKSLS